MIETAAPAGTITQAFSWLPPSQARSARLFGAAAGPTPRHNPAVVATRDRTHPSGNRQAAPCPAPSRSRIIERTDPLTLLSSEIAIDAPNVLVWQMLLDFDSYPPGTREHGERATHNAPQIASVCRNCLFPVLTLAHCNGED